MNNKKLGTAFEQWLVKTLAADGYWVHFIVPDVRGAQPFDVVAAKGGEPYAFDCKTSSRHWFGYSRLEENQKMAFERWRSCGNSNSFLAIFYARNVYMVSYARLEREGYIDLDAEPAWIEDVDIDVS